MDVTAAMIQFVLSKHGVETRIAGSLGCTIKRVKAYYNGAHEAGVLYVAGKSMPRKKPAARNAYAIIHTDDDVDALLENTCAALREIDLWDAQLKDALLERMPLSDFIQLGANMFERPVAYFDRNLITLASSEDYWDRDGLRDDSGLRVEGQMPANLVVDLVEDLDYLKAAEKTEPFYYENAQHLIFYGANTFDDGEYLARLVLGLPEGATCFHTGLEQLIAHYHRYLDDLYLHYAGNVDIVSSQNDALHALARASLLEDIAAPAEGAGVLSSFGWSMQDDFIITKLVFFEGVHWDTISLYLCGLLERAMTASCAFPVDRQIIWLVNLTRSSKETETREREIERLIETLVSIIRDYACRAGISDEFSTLDQAHSYYLEAEHALSIGQTRDPHYWYYRFGNYAFDYLLAKSTEELPANLLCHPALAKLRAYDSENDTEFAPTLVCFLRNSQNTTHAADELFIHRTSFMRRMTQIEKLTSIDLNDPDEVLHLLLSAKLLGM